MQCGQVMGHPIYFLMANGPHVPWLLRLLLEQDIFQLFPHGLDAMCLVAMVAGRNHIIFALYQLKDPMCLGC